MEIYSVEEAAGKLGISVRRVRRLLEEGRLEGKKLGRDWAVFKLGYTKKARGRKMKEKQELILDKYGIFNEHGSWY